jgi:MFS family permease
MMKWVDRTMKFEHLLAIAVFGCTIGTYSIFLTLGRKWRREFEAKGVKYWRSPKEERVQELMSDVWRPKLVAIFHAMAYFTNGYMKISFSMWVPLFLLNVRGISTFEAALFLAIAYTSWQWKMFIGMASDALPITWRGKRYRRHPWFLATGILSVAASMIFVLNDPLEMPVWTTFFAAIAIMTTAGAIFDMAADSYAVDVVPPEYHARYLGGVNAVGMALGGIAASLISPILIGIGGYRLVFIVGGLTGMIAFLFLLLKEPELVSERIFSKQAIAFTFTEKTVLIASLLQMGSAIGLRRFSNPTGGMFSIIMNEVVGIFSPEQAARISLIVLLIGLPSSLIGGWAADKWGHKRTYIITGFVFAIFGFLWMTLRAGMVIWFICLASLTNFIQRLSAGGRSGLLGDSTPLALSGTVFQMYMSFSWIGNVPASIMIGALLPVNIPLLMAVLSSFSFIPLILVRFIKPYEIGKAVKV